MLNVGILAFAGSDACSSSTSVVCVIMFFVTFKITNSQCNIFMCYTHVHHDISQLWTFGLNVVSLGLYHIA